MFKFLHMRSVCTLRTLAACDYSKNYVHAPCRPEQGAALQTLGAENKHAFVAQN